MKMEDCKSLRIRSHSCNISYEFLWKKFGFVPNLKYVNLIRRPRENNTNPSPMILSKKAKNIRGKGVDYLSSPERDTCFKKTKSFSGKKKYFECENVFPEEKTFGPLSLCEDGSDKTFMEIDFNKSRNADANNNQTNCLRRKSSSILQILEKKSVDKCI